MYNFDEKTCLNLWDIEGCPWNRKSIGQLYAGGADGALIFASSIDDAVRLRDEYDLRDTCCILCLPKCDLSHRSPSFYYGGYIMPVIRVTSFIGNERQLRFPFLHLLKRMTNMTFKSSNPIDEEVKDLNLLSVASNEAVTSNVDELHLYLEADKKYVIHYNDDVILRISTNKIVEGGRDVTL